MTRLALSLISILAISGCKTAGGQSGTSDSAVLSSKSDQGGVKDGKSYKYDCDCAKSVSDKDCDHMRPLTLQLDGNSATATFVDDGKSYTGTWQSDSHGQALYLGFHSPDGFGDLGEAEANFDVYIDDDLLKGNSGHFIARYHGDARDWIDLKCKSAKH
jgi:hypothetical protein